MLIVIFEVIIMEIGLLVVIIEGKIIMNMIIYFIVKIKLK